MTFESEILDIKDELDFFIQSEDTSSCLTHEDYFRFMKRISDRISEAFEKII